MKLRIENLYIYPIKSTIGLSLNEIIVNELGFENDRYLGIANSKNEILTAREKPELLNIICELKDNTLKLKYNNKSVETSLNATSSEVKLSLFRQEVFGKTINTKIDKWLSNSLDEQCKLVKIDFENLRSPKSYNISFNDVYPIHLISASSVKKLNEKLKISIESSRYRPNIIISGVIAFEEENWTEIIIGECEFKVVSKTERCSLITINPITGKKDTKQEPLRTLVKEYKSGNRANFGIYLIPTKIGTIQKSDVVKVKY